MIKKTVTMAMIIAMTGGIILTSSQEASSQVIKLRTINSQESIITRTAMTFMQEAEALHEAKIAEERRIAEEQKQKELEAIRLEQERIYMSNNRKNSVNFDAWNLTQVSNITAEELYNVLLAFNDGSLAKYAWTIVDCEEIFDINALFLASLIAQESAWATSDRAIYQNNLTGHAVYNSNATGTYFSSPEESIYNTAKLLYNEYLIPGGHSYYGTSIWNVNTDYCLTEDSSATDYKWSESISSIANSLVNEYHNKVKVLE